MGGMEGMGGGADLGGLGAVMNDPEILEALQDPDVQKAFAVSRILQFLFCFINYYISTSVSSKRLQRKGNISKVIYNNRILLA